MKALASIISYIFHPLLMSLYCGIILILTNERHFVGKDKGMVLIVLFFLTFVMPAVWTLMMKGLGLIDSLKLEK